MPAPQNKGYYLELNESVLLAARTASLGHPPVIEDFREVTLDNKAAVTQALAAVFPEAGAGTARVIGALRRKVKSQKWFELDLAALAKGREEVRKVCPVS